MPTIHFIWTHENIYRTQFRKLLRKARNLSELHPGGGLASVFLSREYQSIVEATCYGYTKATRDRTFPGTLAFAESIALLRIVQSVSPFQLGPTFFVSSSEEEWITSDGDDAMIGTVVAALGAAC